MSNKLKILVVDDNEEFCENVKDVLELKGFEVQTAYGGLKALDIVRQEKINLVLLDIKMPVMDGIAVFKKIKEIDPDISVIMMTAFAVEELIRESLREGAFGILRKPLDFDKLFAMISDTIPDGGLILVVDDNEDLCENMKDIMLQKGFRVSVAYDSNSAIQKARENNFDFLLLDMKLPPLNGLETFQAITDIRPNIVVIIITGFKKDLEDTVEDILKQGAYACIEKPFDIDKLITLLKQINEQKRKGSYKKPE